VFVWKYISNYYTNIYHNTIYLNATSTQTSFGSTGIYASITPFLDLRNNIVVNVSTAGTSGRTVAYQRSSSTMTNYLLTSNNNDFYAGVPSTTNLIYYDATNSIQTITAFRSLVSPRESQSFSELAPL